jgi:hypothetical protein
MHWKELRVQGIHCSYSSTIPLAERGTPLLIAFLDHDTNIALLRGGRSDTEEQWKRYEKSETLFQ